MVATATKRFGIRGFEYYSTCWTMYEVLGDGQMFFVRDGHEVIAGAYAMKFARTSLYKDGASKRRRDDSAAECGLGSFGIGHAIQWEIIRWAKEHGCAQHDLCGTPPREQADDPDHPLYGVGKFKQGFHADITDHLGTYDLPLRRPAYTVWHSGLEREARRLTALVWHDVYY